MLAATEVADLLVRRGVPFREAHGIVGGLVRDAVERGIALSELSEDDLRILCPGVPPAAACDDFHRAGARLVVAPELALSGCPPADLLLRPAFMHACREALLGLAAELADCEGLHLVVGHPHLLGAGDDGGSPSSGVPRRLNAASVLSGGCVLATYGKRELARDLLSDERRYFVSGRDEGQGAVVFEVQGLRLGLLIGEDALAREPARLAQAAGARALCVLGATPFDTAKAATFEARLAACARENGLPLLCAQLVGGQDELVFDGASVALAADGRVAARAPSFEAAAWAVDLKVGPDESLVPGGAVTPVPEPEAQIWQALVTGVRDYVGKNGFPGAIIGLSGGMDSALVLAIAVDALGAQRVRTVMMPSAYTADISWIDARDMAARLGVRYDELPIAPMFAAFRASLAPLFGDAAPDATEENLQARIRGSLLMALSNKSGWIVLTTGNKSETAAGYCTLYGDMAGGFAVIKDVPKTLVYRLAEWKNRQPTRRADLAPGSVGPVIPERIITRPPSAELRPDQKDQDSLPPYDVLDSILARYVESDQSIEDITAAGYARADVERVARLIGSSEYKRQQGPVGIRITTRAFGHDWRYPITSKFRD
jgi:NAD+ synthase (glutamine-hydrolysing)